ncbi:hypothetical protein PoB_006467200 [Plakobranchus ocellatus]|uniref:Secreted protein n=1 Tax=Plakobranchus ocellatus TaxID=259542 RepID=A0AAV4D1U5_9GAST|nr:hypothetical protein PoB_006467200 [Plakobranchus ocellatus]
MSLLYRSCFSSLSLSSFTVSVASAGQIALNAAPMQNDYIRPPSSQGADGGARTRGRRIPCRYGGVTVPSTKDRKATIVHSGIFVPTPFI